MQLTAVHSSLHVLLQPTQNFVQFVAPAQKFPYLKLTSGTSHLLLRKEFPLHDDDGAHIALFSLWITCRILVKSQWRVILSLLRIYTPRELYQQPGNSLHSPGTCYLDTKGYISKCHRFQTEIKSSIFKLVMMQTTEPGMFSPQLHPPSKTKIPIGLIQELIAILKFQVGGREEGRKGKKNKSSTIKTKLNAKKPHNYKKLSLEEENSKGKKILVTDAWKRQDEVRRHFTASTKGHSSGSKSQYWISNLFKTGMRTSTTYCSSDICDCWKSWGGVHIPFKNTQICRLSPSFPLKAV